MKKLDLGTNAFADACGVSTQAMAQYLRNKNVTTKTTYKISEALDINPHDMFFPINEDGNTFIPEHSDNEYNSNEVIVEHVIEENVTSTITLHIVQSDLFFLTNKHSIHHEFNEPSFYIVYTQRPGFATIHSYQ